MLSSHAFSTQPFATVEWPGALVQSRAWMSDARSDEEWMQRYAEGDQEALQVLFQRHAKRMHGFFARAFQDKSTCEDLLQTTFLKLHHARERYLKGAPFLPWLFGIAVRVRADELRKRYRQTQDQGVELDSLPGEERETAESKQTIARVRRAVEALPEPQRLVIQLHRFDGLTFAEIAAVLSETEGKPVQEGAVRVRAFRAHEVLRKALLDLAPEGTSEGKP
jgi:RNA polymerase sigma factor (sigma-70 family)